MKIMKFEYNNKWFLKNIENNSIIMLDEDKTKKIFFEKKYDLEFFNSDFFFKKIITTKSIFIILTTDCNLRCSYCFEQGIKKETLKMTKLSELLTYIDVWMNGETSLEVVFTGGEPLLNFELLKELTLKLNLKYNTLFSLISNGTLFNNKHILFFNKYNYSIQLTLDGWRYNHNKQRSNNIIKDSYSFLLKMSSKILLTNINLTIRVNINKINRTDIYKIINDYKNNLKNNNFKIYFDFIDIDKKSNLYLSSNEKLILLYKIYYLLSKANKKIPYSYVIGGNCQIRNRNSITINSNLYIYNCYSFVSEEKLGVSFNEIDTLYKSKYSCFNENCFYYSLCKGGCLYKNKIKYNKLIIDCNYIFLNKINKYIFSLELYNLDQITLHNAIKNHNNIDLYDIFLDEDKHVEINKYC